MTDQEKKDFAELVATSTATAVAKAMKPDAETDEEKVERLKKEAEASKGEVDLTDPKAVKEHIKQLKLKKAIEGLDPNDPEALEKHLKALEAEVSKDDTDVTPGSIQKNVDADLAALTTGEKLMKSFEDAADVALNGK